MGTKARDIISTDLYFVHKKPKKVATPEALTEWLNEIWKAYMHKPVSLSQHSGSWVFEAKRHEIDRYRGINRLVEFFRAKFRVNLCLGVKTPTGSISAPHLEPWKDKVAK